MMTIDEAHDMRNLVFVVIIVLNPLPRPSISVHPMPVVPILPPGALVIIVSLFKGDQIVTFNSMKTAKFQYRGTRLRTQQP